MPLAQEPGAARYPLRAALLVAALAALGYVFGTAKVPCVFAWLLAAPCPACGSGRSVRALLRGDLGDVFRFNPLGVPAALVLLCAAGAAVFLTWRHGTPRALGTGPRGKRLAALAVAVAVAELLLWLLRSMGMLGAPVPV